MSAILPIKIFSEAFERQNFRYSATPGGQIVHLSKLYFLHPIVSQVIKDKKAYCDLAIVDISDNWSPVEGGKKILLFSKKICRTDIEVHISYTNTDSKC